jgi:hypothetical protein
MDRFGSCAVDVKANPILIKAETNDPAGAQEVIRFSDCENRHAS